MGRIDDVLNVAGHRLGTMEIESALVSNPRIAEAAVVGKPHDIKGESVFAFVVCRGTRPSGDTSKLVQELRTWVGEQLGAIAKPDDIRFADNLPKTRSGKIMRRLLRSVARGEEILQDVSTLENPGILDQLRGVETGKAAAAKAGSAKPAPARAGSAKASAAKTGSAKPSAARTGSAKAAPARTTKRKAAPGKAGPKKPTSASAAPARSAPASAGQRKAARANTGRGRAASAKARRAAPAKVRGRAAPAKARGSQAFAARPGRGKAVAKKAAGKAAKTKTSRSRAR